MTIYYSRSGSPWRNARSVVAGALAAAALSACSSSKPPPPPPPPPPTRVSLEISITADANATPDGQGAPVSIRVYQLAAKSAFEGAEFYELYHTDAATLGPDLIKKDEMLLSPGTSKSMPLMPADSVHTIAVFAAYADFQNVAWRADSDVPPHQTTIMTVTADRSGIKLTAAPGKTAGP
jgi:type VI secretion system protein VasD